MRFAVALSVLIGGAGAAQADCLPGEQTFMACQIEDSGKSLRVCFDNDTVNYRFGPAGQPPELALSATITDVDYTPWPGVGRAIWENVRFTSSGYIYEVYAGFDRMSEDDHASFGGVRVSFGEKNVAELTCAPDGLDFTWGEGLFAAKEAAGMAYDREGQRWITRQDE
ncbi:MULTISPECIES: hypothetical protein [unclassified Yoonia]|uniref:hypothetical protein n=1 Tax=unclassified Yoonia TaxID=2629118 RepID=UPI002AFF1B96|nr:MULTISPECIES: hypothetical protein [unclassified Yoonia]